MLDRKRIKVGKKYIEAFAFSLGKKNLLILKGSRGFVMCGYLNLSAAARAQDAAVKIIGVSTLKEAIDARVYSCTPQASRLGVSRGQPIREVLRKIV